MNQRWRRADRRRRILIRGQSVVEFALVLPIFLFLLMMTVDFGRFAFAWVAVSNAAKEGALYGARNPICDTNGNGKLCPDPQNVTWHVQNEEADLPGIAAPVIECLAPDGTPRSLLSECQTGDTYVVQARYDFTLLTPVLSEVLGSGITLQAESRAAVLNLAFDPTPGAMITKRACFGASCVPASTPILDADNNQVYVEGSAGQPIKYLITVTNIGGQLLTGTSITDTNGLPLGTGGCPALPSTLAIAQIWQCTYAMTAPNTNGLPTLLYSNTATFGANEIQPRQATATVKIDANPGDISVAKYVSPYQEGGSGSGPFGTDSSIVVGTSSQTSVWYQVVVSNPGDAAVAIASISDDQSPLVVSPTCPAQPASLAPHTSWACLYNVLFTSTGSTTNTVRVQGSPGSRSASATVTAQACAVGQAPVPRLVGLRKSDAAAAWGGAGFSPGNLTMWSGHTNDNVATQNVQAYKCMPTGPSGATMTVTN